MKVIYSGTLLFCPEETNIRDVAQMRVEVKPSFANATGLKSQNNK